MIVRDPAGASTRTFDLIVIGGGIYGVCIAMEAARRGLAPLLIERGDFGGATSWNSLRIIHGGLRYLQTLDLRRHRESVGERSWFLREFPDLVRPLACLMPLHGTGLKRPSVFHAALRINDLLSPRRNEGLHQSRRLSDGRLISAVDTRLMFPEVKRKNLRGAALWHDAVMVSPQRILMEILLAAHRMSPDMMSLNYVEAVSVLSHPGGGRRGNVAGVAAIDRLVGETIEFRAPCVIDATGPWCEQNRFSPHCAGEIVQPSLAYNLLIDRPPLSKAAVAVSSGRAEARTYFAHSACRGGVLVGTEHTPVHEWDGGSPQPSTDQIRATLGQLNDAIPGWNLVERDVLRVYCGLLPARVPGTDQLAVRPAVFDHAKRGGPRGLLSVCGVKFTTARLVAERVVSRLCLPRKARPCPFRRDAYRKSIDLIDPDQMLNADAHRVRDAVQELIDREAVVTTDDLLLRRTGWLDAPCDSARVRARIRTLHDAELRRAVRYGVSQETHPVDGPRTTAILKKLESHHG